MERIDPILGIDDTHPQVRAMMIERHRRLSADEIADELNDACLALHQFQVAGLRERFPRASEEELEFKAAAIRMGVELARRAVGADHPWLGGLTLSSEACLNSRTVACTRARCPGS